MNPNFAINMDERIRALKLILKRSKDSEGFLGTCITHYGKMDTEFEVDNMDMLYDHLMRKERAFAPWAVETCVEMKDLKGLTLQPAEFAPFAKVLKELSGKMEIHLKVAKTYDLEVKVLGEEGPLMYQDVECFPKQLKYFEGKEIGVLRVNGNERDWDFSALFRIIANVIVCSQCFSLENFVEGGFEESKVLVMECAINLAQKQETGLYKKVFEVITKYMPIVENINTYDSEYTVNVADRTEHYEKVNGSVSKSYMETIDNIVTNFKEIAKHNKNADILVLAKFFVFDDWYIDEVYRLFKEKFGNIYESPKNDNKELCILERKFGYVEARCMLFMTVSMRS
ncbi:unnamed protein product [Bursaphelenchus okinawaensis]|uniref:Uncharacterized protein n=1 Tax=Bursaphelenchus okinawaensis TaxID=465554 RepID=A0A811KAY3_9BILA|nr:unnamed protein product [Bursaphelenchus okinawaensis]CAG9097010.1 unnamed protein product [Bursaphelenchus okinawaensis]